MLTRGLDFRLGHANCDGATDWADIDAWVAALFDSCTGWTNPCPCSNFDINHDGMVDFADLDPFVALLGQGLSKVTRSFAWDAENRLISVTPTVDPNAVPTPLPRQVKYRYDQFGRRVERKVYTWNTSGRAWNTTPSEHVKYVWGGASFGGLASGQSSGWLLLMELDGLNNNAVLRRYTWGLDLAGQSGFAAGTGAGGPASGRSSGLESAGGIGGLLSVQEASDPNAPYVFFYDGNGNVTQVAQDIRDPVLTAAAKLKARYEYDPYGNIVGPNPDGNDVIDPNEAGPYAAVNTFRFSTKPWDDATGFGYWGFRYYMPRLGRWMSWDPIGERGGWNVLAYAANNPTAHVDPSGHACRLFAQLNQATAPVSPCLHLLDADVDKCKKLADQCLAPIIKMCQESCFDACPEHDTCVETCIKRAESSCTITYDQCRDTAQINFTACIKEWQWVPAPPPTFRPIVKPDCSSPPT